MSHPLTEEPFCTALYAKGDGLGHPSVHSADGAILALMRNQGSGSGRHSGIGGGDFWKRPFVLARPGDDLIAALINTLCRMQP